jgi:hypothetical protein
MHYRGEQMTKTAFMVHAAVAGILLALTVAAPPPALGQAAGTVKIKVKSGTEIRVGVHSTWKTGTCLAHEEVVIVITKPPTNGAASVRRTDYKPEGCAWTVPATGIYYKSNPGFVGTDRFSFDRKPGSGGEAKLAGIRDVIVQVTP